MGRDLPVDLNQRNFGRLQIMFIPTVGTSAIWSAEIMVDGKIMGRFQKFLHANYIIGTVAGELWRGGGRGRVW